MWRGCWFRTDSQGDDALAYASDVLLANWIAPMAQPEASLPAPVQELGESEAGDFLVRVYAYQEC